MPTAKIVVCDQLRTDFMRACDVFEPGKVLGHTFVADVEDVEKFRTGVDKIRAAVQTADPNLRVVAVGDPESAQWLWRDPGVTAVSDGNCWWWLDG